MNLGPGGKQPCMHPGSFKGISQSMVFPNDYPNEKLRGKPKGLKIILEERGLWPENGKLLARCPSGCKGKTDCCAERIMFLQEDFLAQKPLLAEIIEKAGHKCIFYPKFHCEFNFIEFFFQPVKEYCRKHCDYSWNGLRKTILEALTSVNLKTIQKYR